VCKAGYAVLVAHVTGGGEYKDTQIGALPRATRRFRLRAPIMIEGGSPTQWSSLG